MADLGLSFEIFCCLSKVSRENLSRVLIIILGNNFFIIVLIVKEPKKIVYNDPRKLRIRSVKI